MNQKEDLITYGEVLRKLSLSPNEQHLLLGNGFNLSLGVNTGYENILAKMKEEFPTYKQLEGNEYNIEKIIGDLTNKINDAFLKEFIPAKIKLDFMKSTYSIVKNELKNIYQEKNEGVLLLFEKFTNYFTLNYDPLLYLLLMRFKDVSRTRKEQAAYELIKNFYDNAKVTISDRGSVNVRDLSKTQFIAFASSPSKNPCSSNRKVQALTQKVIGQYYDEIKHPSPDRKIKVNDGFNKKFYWEQSDEQNLFFLHGAFHLYEKDRVIYKITSKQDKALYERLWNIISDENENLLCVFKADGKLADIKANPYLKNSYDKLQSLKGSIVIIGSSLAENDKHIFDAIQESSIENIYIACSKDKKDDFIEKTKTLFEDKNIVLFDQKSISYDKKS